MYYFIHKRHEITMWKCFNDIQSSSNIVKDNINFVNSQEYARKTIVNTGQRLRCTYA